MREFRKTHPLNPEDQAKLRQQQKEWAKKNKDRWNHPDGYKKRSILKRLYGITLEQYNELLEACKGKCPICQKKFRPERREPQVDHCHKTGAFRGLICGNCNTAEGKLGTPEVALRMYEYMKRNELFYQGVN